MQYQNITISKSKTVGIMTPDGRTKFKKIQITASANLDEKDDADKAYKEVSDFIERQFEYEKKIK